MAQAVRDSAGTDDLPAVFHRRSKMPWLVVMRLEDWVELYRAYLAKKEGNTEESA